MEVTARLGKVQISPRKARLVADLARDRQLVEAQQIMRFVPNKTARDLGKLLQSVAANAENNYDLDPDDLWIKAIYVDEGPSMRRFRAKARGRVGRIQKRSSIITVVVEDREER